MDVGTVIAGKLRVERVLGRGGMGVVVVAKHLQLDQLVAVKVLRDELATDEVTVARFLREGQASARLRSDHVCRVFDVGTLETGAPYLVMELLEGGDLASVIAVRPLPVAEAAAWVVQACEAIGEAHELGIIHRDLKPSNLFVTRKRDGTTAIKVLDFGIAKAPDDGNLQLTQTATMMGSPAFMSPEQLRSARDVDARTDIWALGVILYQCVTGRLPFPASSITELAAKILIEPPEPLHVEPRFDAIVMRCLEKDRERRYPTVGALAGELAACRLVTGDRMAVTAATMSGHYTGAPAHAPPRSRRAWYAIGAFAVAAIVIAAVSRGGSTSAPLGAVAGPPPSSDIGERAGAFGRAMFDHRCRDAMAMAKALDRPELVKQAESCVPLKPKTYPMTPSGAEAAVAAHDPAQGLAIAEGLLERSPNDNSLVTLVGVIACEAHDADTAQRYVPRIYPIHTRAEILEQCRQLGVVVQSP